MKNQRIIFATGNQGKIRELQMILADLDRPVLSMKEAGVHPEIEENGSSFAENALIKAKAVAELLPEDIVLADDSGLVIDYLNGEPGIYSSRYMGEDTPYTVKNARILERMADVPYEQRTARFVCAIAAVLPDGRTLTAQETMEGRIADHIAGEHGFGYDPIFWLDECGCTSAEISPEQKNELSHRGKSLRRIKELLKEECYADTCHE